MVVRATAVYRSQADALEIEAPAKRRLADEYDAAQGESLATGSGRTFWELVQKTSERFVFDPDDLVATLAGIGTASLLFYIITPRTTERG